MVLLHEYWKNTCWTQVTMNNLKTAHMLITSSTKLWKTSCNLWRLDVQLLDAGQMYRARQVVISKWITGDHELIQPTHQLIQAWMICWLVGFWTRCAPRIILATSSPLEKLAHSYALAQSVRLGGFELVVERSIADTRRVDRWPPKEKMLMKLYK